MIPKLKSACDPFFGSILLDELFNDPTKVSTIPEVAVMAEAGQTVFSPGDRPDSIYVLQDGEADIYVQDSRKVNSLSNTVEAGRMYGMVEAVSEGEMWYSMKTRTKCTFRVLSRHDLLAELSRDSALCFRLAQILSRMNREILSFAVG